MLELETDKATLEVPSTVGGRVAEIKVKQGDKVKPGQVVLVLDDGGGPRPPIAAPAGLEPATAPPQGRAAADAASKSAGDAEGGPIGARRRMMAASGPEPADARPTRGDRPGGPGAAPAESGRHSPPTVRRSGQPSGRRRAQPASARAGAPSVRRLARELGVDSIRCRAPAPGPGRHQRRTT